MSLKFNKKNVKFDHRIDANVEVSELNVEAAHGEILQYFQSISSNRYVYYLI